MVRHAGGLFERADVLEIGGDAGGAEAVVADLGRDARDQGAPPYHRIGIGLGQGDEAGTHTDTPERARVSSRAIPI